MHEAVIFSGGGVIARHRRSYEREAVVFDSLHHLALFEQKTRTLDQAAPLAKWQLPDCFARLRRLLEARTKKHGSWKYVQALRLMEKFSHHRSNSRRRRPATPGHHGRRCREASAAVPHLDTDVLRRILSNGPPLSRAGESFP